MFLNMKQDNQRMLYFLHDETQYSENQKRRSLSKAFSTAATRRGCPLLRTGSSRFGKKKAAEDHAAYPVSDTSVLVVDANAHKWLGMLWLGHTALMEA